MFFLGNLMIAFQICPNSGWKWLNMQWSQTVFFCCVYMQTSVIWPSGRILKWWFCVIPSRPSRLSSVISFANHRLKCCASSFQGVGFKRNWCFWSCREENSWPISGPFDGNTNTEKGWKTGCQYATNSTFRAYIDLVPVSSYLSFQQ